MMTQQEYATQKQSVIEGFERLPFKIVSAQELRLVGRTGDGVDIISVQGHEFPAQYNVIQSLDEYCGITPQQQSIVHASDGENGVRDLRNYLTAAKAKTQKHRFVVHADPLTGQVVGAKPIIREYISPASFFSVAEAFMNEHNLLPESFAKDDKGNFSIKVVSSDPAVRVIGKKDEIELSGYYLSSNGTQVELGVYQLRRVCTNGMMVEVPSAKAKIYDVSASSISQLIGMPLQSDIQRICFERLSQKAELAMAAPASIRELRAVNSIIHAQNLPNAVCEQIAPIIANEEAYEQKGVEIRDPRRCVSNINAWDLYNNMTAFATHNTIWQPQDIRRDAIRLAAQRFLDMPRDIKPYTNIFRM